MNEILPRIATRAGWPLLFFMLLSAAPCHSGPLQAGTVHASKQQLTGAWRLVSIQIEGPSGPMMDPFYHEGSTGILIYDPSGWMSVQIVGQQRPSMDAAAARPSSADTPETAQLKAKVLDTYYAYFGTWEYDEASSTVTHHIKSALIPGETGMSYSQGVTLEGGNLIFTTQRKVAGGIAVQRKVWKRISDRD